MMFSQGVEQQRPLHLRSASRLEDPGRPRPRRARHLHLYLIKSGSWSGPERLIDMTIWQCSPEPAPHSFAAGSRITCFYGGDGKLEAPSRVTNFRAADRASGQIDRADHRFARVAHR